MRCSPCLLLVGVGALLTGCRPAPPPPPTSPAVVKLPPATPLAGVEQADSLPLELSREEMSRNLLENLKKPVMGRRPSLQHVERIAREIAPILHRAAQQPQVQASLKLYAQDNGWTLEEARSRWLALQEADILLESGGDPELVSSANAVGVAQWIEETGRRAGLKIDIERSRLLTGQIDSLKRQIAWREYLLRPDADPSLPGAPAVPGEEAAAQLPALRRRLESLRAARRAVDQRYDVEKALYAHTRYLLRLYPRFPGMDWVFQAYHGGEAGVERTLKRFLGKAWPGSAAASIRAGNGGGRLRFEQVYFEATPQGRPEAFSYLYGRGDDHRHYWWKIQAAVEALALYRRDPQAFRQVWESLMPGRPREAIWYPMAEALSFADEAAARAGMERGLLVAVGDTPEWTVRPAPANSAGFRASALRPESLAALRLIAAGYRQAGGTGRLEVGDLTVTAAPESDPAARPVRPLLYPPAPDAGTRPGGGPPEGYDFHRTGLALDILRPEDREQRKILEYVLDYFARRQILWWWDRQDRSPRHYHLVPNPRYAAALLQRVPSEPLPGL
jgi:hypothetical protein